MTASYGSEIALAVLLGRIEQVDSALSKVMGLSSQLTPDERAKLHRAWSDICEVEGQIRARALGGRT
jgi:hypothetical protein